jgi:hypothetical protein
MCRRKKQKREQEPQLARGETEEETVDEEPILPPGGRWLYLQHLL